MYYYSNNYSKYIEKLKLEKSKVAFRKLIEDTKEEKSPDIIIQDVLPSKNNSTISDNIDISSKEDQKFSFEENGSKKSGKKVDTENIRATKKSENNFGLIESGSSKESNDIISERDFSDIEPNNLNIDSSFGDKENSNIEFESSISDKSNKELNFENDNSSKSENNIKSFKDFSLKPENDINNSEDFSEKNEENLRHNINPVSKDENELKSNGNIPEKDENELNPDNDFVSKDENELTNKNVFGHRRHIDIIKLIKEEKKREGKFVDAVSEPKKQEFTNLNRQYKVPATNPRLYENSKYEANAYEYKYYPAGSYSEIDAKQINAIEDAVSTISNESNWTNGFGKAVVSSLKVATDIIDMINLVGPSTNIYREGKTANNLRWDLKVDNKYTSSKDWVSISGKKGEDHPGDYEQSTTETDFANSKHFLTEKNDDDLPQMKFAKIKRTSSEYETIETHETNDATDAEIVEGKESKNISGKTNTEDSDTENFAEAEDFSKKEDDELSFKYDKRDGNDVSENIAADSVNKTKEDSELTFKYKNQLIENIAAESLGDEKRWYDRDEGKYIGRIYVIPPFEEVADSSNVNNEESDDISKNIPFSIPLQNNLTFEQTSRAAAWNAISFFGRIGDIQQYAKTGNLDAITLTTKYFVEDNDITTSGFTMSKLQDIEMMYRSLVLPASVSSRYLYRAETDKSNYYYFTRPPIINIVLGNTTVNTNGEPVLKYNKSKPYFNLFTDIYSTPINDGGANKSEDSIYYKNFVVTNVSIDKNTNEYNYYVDGEKYYDTTGFTVTMTILEIDENYLGSLPSFNNYEYTLKGRGAI